MRIHPLIRTNKKVSIVQSIVDRPIHTNMPLQWSSLIYWPDCSQDTIRFNHSGHNQTSSETHVSTIILAIWRQFHLESHWRTIYWLLVTPPKRQNDHLFHFSACQLQNQNSKYLIVAEDSLFAERLRCGTMVRVSRHLWSITSSPWKLGPANGVGDSIWDNDCPQCWPHYNSVSKPKKTVFDQYELAETLIK